MYNSFQLLYQVRKNVNNDGASSLNFLRGPLSIETKKEWSNKNTEAAHGASAPTHSETKTT